MELTRVYSGNLRRNHDTTNNHTKDWYMTKESDLKDCPFCGASNDMHYIVDGKSDVDGMKYPMVFCDACKATVYFEDSTSLGYSDQEDYDKLLGLLKDGWNSRGRKS